MYVNRIPGGGGGFPPGWNMKAQGRALEDIAKNTPIVLSEYSDWSNGVGAINPNDLGIPTAYQRYNFTAVAITGDGQYVAYAYQHPTTNMTGLFVCKKRSGVDIYDQIFTITERANLTINDLAWDPSGTYLVMLRIWSSAVPAVTLYKLNRVTDTIAQIQAFNPTASPSGTYLGVAGAWNPVGNELAMSYYEGSRYYVNIYAFANEQLTIALLNLLQNTSQINALTYSADNNFLLVGTDGSPGFSLWQRVGDGAPNFTNASALIPARSSSTPTRSAKFSPNGVDLAMAGWTTGTGALDVQCARGRDAVFTKRPNPAVMPGTFQGSVDINNDGTYLAITGISGTLAIYEIPADTSQPCVKMPDPSPMPANAGSTSVLAFGHSALVIGSPYVNTTSTPPAGLYKTISVPEQVIRSRTRLEFDPLFWLRGKYLGIALQNAEEGEQCKVNLFPILNELNI